jgi:hypothetical protein
VWGDVNLLLSYLLLPPAFVQIVRRAQTRQREQEGLRTGELRRGNVMGAKNQGLHTRGMAWHEKSEIGDVPERSNG